MRYVEIPQITLSEKGSEFLDDDPDLVPGLDPMAFRHIDIEPEASRVILGIVL